ncbi:MAG: tRNA (adenosine(37)-N6)-dimethylallyltransferase MiaA [Bacteroidales bacterium]|jgi:tRNA dimethylallyltransferase|nr:tRNA (adenosine(37)-N6)-dimethylallyltransferase MiaA [Bacteroidales bacterium]
MSKNLIVVVGPTGVGKTSAGIKIAQHFSTEIVSADSRQIFRELSIGTAVPSPEELSAIKHHFIHSHSIHENYNASRYEYETLELLTRLFLKYDTILMVGGSMLYIDAVCKGIDIMPDVDIEIRQHVKNTLVSEGIEAIRMQLKKLDPEYYLKVDLKNHARIVHAIEICLTTGKTYSSFLSNQNKKRPFGIIKIGINTDRDQLHSLINKRVDKMIYKGLEDEARQVYRFKELISLNTVGYREWFNCFDGKTTSEDAIGLIKRNTRRYARKQLTWFNKDKTVTWFEPHQLNEIITFTEQRIFKK